MSLPEIIEVPAERALSPTQIDLAEFTVNPYKGCGVGCVYCYARSNRSLLKIKKEWGSFVLVKKNIVRKLEEELSGKTVTGSVLIGSTTEPFQETEEKYRLTRDVIELLGSKNIPFVLLTKSPAAAEMAGRMLYSGSNRVYMTVNSGMVRELFEKNSGLQRDRFRAVKVLADAGVRTVVYISPVFPFLTDMNELLEELVKMDCGKVELRAESYNPKMGNWAELKQLLPENLKEKYESIFSSQTGYDRFWGSFRSDTEKLFSSRGLSIGIKIEPFDSWYLPGASHSAESFPAIMSPNILK